MGPQPGRPNDFVAEVLRDGQVAPPEAVVCAFLERHRLAPYLAHRLTRAGRDAGRLAAAYAQAVARAALRAPLALDVLRLCLAAGTRPVLFKGLGVAHLAYPTPELRPLGDLDLLVREPEVDAAVAALRAAGFRYLNEDPAVVAFWRREAYAVSLVRDDVGLVEIHHALYRDCCEAFLHEVLARTILLSMADLRVEVLAPDDLFLVLAVHWVEGGPGTRWVWLLDLVLLADELTPDTWARLDATSRRHGLDLFVVAALDAMQRLWHAEPPGGGEARRAAAARLRFLEKRALVSFAAALGSGETPIPGDRLLTARRLSGRPVRGGWPALTRMLVPPAGAVCDDEGVRSDDPLVPYYRARHLARRLWRAVRAV